MSKYRGRVIYVRSYYNVLSRFKVSAAGTRQECKINSIQSGKKISYSLEYVTRSSESNKRIFLFFCYCLCY